MTLLSHHRDHLRESGLSDETLQASGIRSIQEGQSHGLGYPAGLSGILIPYPGTTVRIGGRAMPYTRLRVDVGCRRAEGRKYENPLKDRIEEGLPYYPYVPDDVGTLRKTDAPVFITEGEKKALALTQAGFPTLGLPGVFMFSDPRSSRRPADKPLHPDLKRWRWRKRRAFVVFDSDRTEKDGVALAHERLCKLLTAAGTEVRVVVVPGLEGLGKTGADDFLVRHGPAAFRELVEAAQPWVPFEYLVELVPSETGPATLATALGPAVNKLVGASREERQGFAEAVHRHLPSVSADQALELVQPTDGRGVPAIVVNGRQLRAVVTDAWKALKGSEFGPRVFSYGDALVYVPDASTPRVQPVDVGLMSWMLNRSADWLRINQAGHECDTRLPLDVPKDMLAGNDARVERLDGIVRVPVLGMSGQVATGRYDRRSRLLQVVDRDVLQLARELPARPNDRERASAMAFVKTELLRDFPFARQSDRTHALAALLLPLVRHFIAGPTPLHLIEAPSEGTGKSLLADVVHLVATGERAQPTPLSTREEELRKKLTAMLATSPVMVLFDNVNHAVDSASLAALLASETWSDRLLGQSKQLVLPNRAQWMATANNPVLSRELARRTIRIRLDAGVERPWLRARFRHDDLVGWVREQRAEVVAALLTLVRGWLADGRPAGSVRLGTYEAWSRVVGGVLDSSDIEGFLADRHQDQALVDPVEADWASLIELWAERFDGEAVSGTQVMEVAVAAGLFGLEVGSAQDASARARFTRELGKRRDRVYGGRRIRVTRDKKRKQNVYVLV